MYVREKHISVMFSELYFSQIWKHTLESGYMESLLIHVENNNMYNISLPILSLDLDLKSKLS